uniref:DUF2281 domain-containing protein n=1 Tax=Candidatus Kentrum sp. FW TaxID=2126338 RepID=A0A450RVW5_9GAMM|nr:MAG: hypothetical protein BECKFW1821A_GA0114235_100364 [Candidatus Kentron sp. FW]VFJ61877.1 MAG: hypothetical protein BECKFW1821B_GA0114236_106811 [Candidatus Kentron sp. FW]
MTLQEKIMSRTQVLPESTQREIRAFIQSIEARGRHPKEGIGSSSESTPSHPISALDLALAHDVVGCVQDAPADLSTNKDYMREYGE